MNEEDEKTKRRSDSCTKNQCLDKVSSTRAQAAQEQKDIKITSVQHIVDGDSSNTSNTNPVPTSTSDKILGYRNEYQYTCI